MQLPDIEVFVAVVESGSLSAAARKLGLTPMTASRRLASLEREVATRLIHRTTRSASLTPEGEALLPHAQTMLDAHDAARSALGHVGSASGTLKLTAPAVFGQTVIMPLIPQLLRQNPGLRVDLMLSDSIVDIVGLGLDLAIRLATLRDSGLVARRLSANPRVLCASPAYLSTRGTPSTTNDLTHHDCISLHGMSHWPFERDGAIYPVRGDARFSANSVEAVRTACLQGLGLALLTYWDVRDQLNDGSLTQVQLLDAGPENLAIAAVLPTRQYVPARVRVFLDCLEAFLNKET